MTSISVKKHRALQDISNLKQINVMKNIYLTLSVLLITSVLSAQNKNTKIADKLYNRYEFIAASKAYLKLVEKNKADSYVYKQLADSYYNIFNTTEAAKWYAKATEEPQDAETYHRYAQMLKANGNYTEANKQMANFAALSPKDYRAIQFVNDPNYLEKLNNQEKMFTIKNSDINSDKSDFGAVLSDNTLYLTSARNEAAKKFAWNNEPRLDIYMSTLNQDATFSPPVLVNELNSKYNDGPLAITQDGNTLYFATESFKEKVFFNDKDKRTKYGMVSLYKATKTNGKWGNIEALPFNGKKYSTSNPSISKDGKTLYFSSNMPGSIGATDIWKVAIDSDGNFGTPENLGPTVNTEGRESFPFIADDDKLYFSSDSHPGFGGYDIFVTDLNSNQIKNVGKPVNSEKDDFAFSYNKTKKMGFFSSNRIGQDDIYILNQLRKVLLLATIIDAKTGKAVPEALVTILENNKAILEKTTSAEGKINQVLLPENENIIQVSSPGYNKKSQLITLTDNDELALDILLDPIEPIITETEIILQEIYFEFNKSNITQRGATELDKLVQVMKENPELEIIAKSHTDNRGSEDYNKELSERRAKETAKYVVSKGIDSKRISAKGYGESEPKVNCTECTDEEHAKNRRSEFIIVKK